MSVKFFGTNNCKTSPEESYIISGGTVIDVISGNKSLADVLIRGDKISQVAPHATLRAYKDIKVINAAGLYLIPGLFDMHVHMTVWPEFTDKISSLFIANGVTSVRDMGGRLEDVVDFRRQTSESSSIAPRMWIAGPIIDGTPRLIDGDPLDGLPDIAVSINTPEEAEKLVRELIKSDVDFIKPYEMLRPEVFTALVKLAGKHNLNAAGHIPVTMRVSEVLDIAPYDIQHISGLSCECVAQPRQLIAEKMAVISQADSNKRGVDIYREIMEKTTKLLPDMLDPERRDNVIKKMAKQKAWCTPTLIITAGASYMGFDKDPDWFNAIAYLPKNRQENIQKMYEGEDAGDINTWSKWRLDIVKDMYKAGVRLLAGTDSPPMYSPTPGFALHFELKALVKSGIPPFAALQAATINAAEFFALDNKLGSIHQGKYADLVLLEADPLSDINNTRRIDSVVSRGRFLSRKKLDQILNSIQT